MQCLSMLALIAHVMQGEEDDEDEDAGALALPDAAGGYFQQQALS